MYLVFICLFNNVEYIKLLYLLLESIFIFGNLGETTKILIYTSTEFMRLIKNSHLYNPCLIIFETNDTYNNVTLACKARLDLFELETVKYYKTILYLDSDVLVKGDLAPIFKIAELGQEVIYAIEEGNFDDSNHFADFYGLSLFGHRDIEKFKGMSAFSSGVMLFKNCQTIKDLFKIIKQDIRNRPREFACHDQPYIVHNAFKTGLYDNTAIKPYAVNNDLNIYSDKVIHHFPGNTGIHYNKQVEMVQFLNGAKEFTIQKYINTCKTFMEEHLIPIIRNIGEPLEGNIFMEHNTLNYYRPYENKVRNICNIVLNKNITNVLEIGFGSGFSALLMLISNSALRITCVDLAEHKYVQPCYQKIKETFGDRIHLIIGDSTQVLPQTVGSFDLIHIDGSSHIENVRSDVKNSFRLSKKGTILILDDYDFQHLHSLWDRYVQKFRLKNLNIYLSETDLHSIKYVINQRSRVSANQT